MISIRKLTVSHLREIRYYTETSKFLQNRVVTIQVPFVIEQGVLLPSPRMREVPRAIPGVRS